MENFIGDIAARLGVAFGEKFYIENYEGHLISTWDTNAATVFMFDKNYGLISTRKDGERYTADYAYLADLILGRYKIMPYVEGLDQPQTDRQLKDIYEYCDGIVEDTELYISESWLDSKKPFFKNPDKEQQYKDLQHTIMDIYNAAKFAMSLPIFAGTDKK